MDVYMLELDMTYDGKQLVGVYSTLDKAKASRTEVRDDAEYGEWEELIPKNAWYAPDNSTAGWALLIRRLTVDKHYEEPIAMLIPAPEGPR